MTNPYDGQEPFATAWQHGFDYGLANSGTDNPTLPDFSSWGHDDANTAYIGEVWRHGVATGRHSTSATATVTAGSGLDGGVAPGPRDAGAPGGVDTPPAQPSPIDWSHVRAHTAKFWINAFISPEHVEGPFGWRQIWNYYYFAGDGREFSTEIHAPSRMHSEVEISGLNTGHPQITFQWHDCGETIAYDEHMHEVDRRKAHPQAQFGNPHWDGGTKVIIDYRGAAANPLVSVSPDIDAHGLFSVDLYSGEVAFDGMIDAFPWFEAYATANNGAAVTLIQEPPTGAGPEALIGDANRNVFGSGQAPLN